MQFVDARQIHTLDVVVMYDTHTDVREDAFGLPAYSAIVGSPLAFGPYIRAVAFDDVGAGDASLQNPIVIDDAEGRARGCAQASSVLDRRQGAEAV